jgi:hypothetical protein
MLKVLLVWKKTIAVMAVAVFCAVDVSQAITIQFSTSGAQTATIDLQNGLTATITLNALGSGTINLTPGIAQNVLINTVDFDTIPQYSGFGSRTLYETLYINSPSSTPTSRQISQLASASTTDPTIFDPSVADVILYSGALVTFDLGSAGTLTVTPSGGTLIGQTMDNSVSFNNMAQFLLTAIPEPAATVALGAVAGLLLARRRQ